jgi:hypothetical protein
MFTFIPDQENPAMARATCGVAECEIPAVGMDLDPSSAMAAAVLCRAPVLVVKSPPRPQ